MARITIHPREAAALHRLLDAYTADAADDPGRPDLVAFMRRLEHVEMDHSNYGGS